MGDDLCANSLYSGLWKVARIRATSLYTCVSCRGSYARPASVATRPRIGAFWHERAAALDADLVLDAESGFMASSVQSRQEPAEAPAASASPEAPSPIKAAIAATEANAPK